MATYQVYTGKNLEHGGVQSGLCSKVVLEMMLGLEDDGHCLVTDNYYTSPQLYLTLYNKGVNCTNRSGYPKDLIKKGIPWLH